MRPAAARTAVLVALALGAVVPGPGGLRAAPLRTGTPATGVVGGFTVTNRLQHTAERGPGETLEAATWTTQVLYTPSTHWAVAVDLPAVLDRTIETGEGRLSTAGLGDVAVRVKHRFFRQVGRWSDRHAAWELGVELPTGRTGVSGLSSLPPAARHAAQPGSGSTDLLAALVYQQAQGRFVQAADLRLRRNGTGSGSGSGGYREGGEARLGLDAEYVLFPRDYREPGRELFVLLEAAAVHRDADRLDGAGLPGTRRTELLLAPGLLYVATERVVLGLSLQLPVASDVEAGGRRSRWDALLEVRAAF